MPPVACPRGCGCGQCLESEGCTRSSSSCPGPSPPLLPSAPSPPGGTSKQQIVYFLNSYRSIHRAFINSQEVSRTTGITPPGWNWTYYGQDLDMNSPLRVDLYDQEGNKVFTPVTSLTSQSLGTQFGVPGHNADGAGYYAAGTFPAP